MTLERAPGTPAGPDGLTVVVPTRGRDALLEQTLRSVAEQTRPPDAVVVSHDGESAGTAAIAARTGARYVAHLGAPRGAAATRNAGLAAVATPLVAFLDDDDLLAPSALERLTAALRAVPRAPFAFGWALVAARLDDGWQPSGLIAPEPRELVRPLSSLAARNYVPSGGTVARTEAARRVGGADVALRYSQDHALWLKLARLGEPTLVEDVVCVYRRHPDNRRAALAALPYDLAVSSQLSADRGLRCALSERLGMLVCEIAAEAWHLRCGGHLGALVRPVAAQHVRIPLVMRGAVRHFRLRRRAARRGAAVWAQREDLRRWLDGF